MKVPMMAGLVLALGVPLGASAQTSLDLQAIRQEIDTLRAAYEARLQALEQRLQAAEAAAKAAPTAAPAAATPQPAPAAPATSQSATATAGTFNPAISLILSGMYTRTSRDPSSYRITGFSLPADGEVGPGTRGLSLAESELGLSASIDPWLRGALNLALAPDNSVSVEEAYVQTTSLGQGFGLKAGRFLSGVGYLNAQHAHAWDFVDNPLAYQALLGTQYADDGLQLTWLAPTDRYLQLGLEIGRGRSYPGSDTGRNGAGMAALTAKAGGDWGDSHSWLAGVSVLSARADDQALAGLNANGSAVTNAFSGRTRVWVLDGVWKWAPGGNATRTSFKLQGEVLHSTRRGSLAVDLDNTGSVGDYHAVQSGWYVQGIYQFMPGWRVGLRTERLDPGTPDYGLNAGLLAPSSYHPRKDSLMVDFSASEFSRVRVQFANDRAREGRADHQFFVQYQMSLGAHGAHGY